MKKEYIIKGARFIDDGIINFKDWSKKMMNEFGTEIVPHLASLWDEANYLIESSKLQEENKQKKNESVNFDNPNSTSEVSRNGDNSGHTKENTKKIQLINNDSLLSDFKPNSIIFLLMSICIILNPPYLVNKLLHPGIWNGPKYTEREFHFLFKSPQNSEIEISLIFIELLALIISILIQKIVTSFFKKSTSKDN